MAWETQREKKYYYRSRRVGDKVVKEYIGTGPEAERVAEQDRREREHRKSQREVIRCLETELADATKVVDGLIEYGDLMVAASLLGAGFKFRKNEWRRRDDQTGK